MFIRKAFEPVLGGTVLLLVFSALSCGGDSPTAPAPRVAQVIFAASQDTVEIGSTAPLSVSLVDSRGNPVTGRSPTWSVADTTVATVSAAGVVSGRALGSTAVTAVADSAIATATVVVRPVSVSQIVLASASVAVNEGDTLTLPAPTLIDRNGATTTTANRTVTYLSSAPGVLTVSAAGQLHAVAPGSATVTIIVDKAMATVSVTVNAAPIGHIHVTPSVADVAIGHLVHTQAVAFSVAGAKLAPRQYTYSSSNPAVATVNSSGVVSGVAAGSATITLTTAGGSTTVPVSVAQLGGGGFHIDLRFIGNVSTTLRTAATTAASRWEQVITKPLDPYQVVVNANECGAGLPAVNESVQNMIIYIQADSIDGPGNTAGEGGPCVLRDPPSVMLTALGSLTVDTADVAYAASNGSLVDLLTHEMGHILGIGTLWGTSFFPNTTTGLGTSDPLFIGAKARGAATALAFTNDSSLGVPIENTGGAGTRDGHWRASVFGHELMTGTLHLGGNPMSLVTVQALADLGYTVAPQAAADFSALNATSPGGYPSASANVLPPSPALPLGEKIFGPRFTTSRTGRLRTIPGSTPRPTRSTGATRAAQ